MHKIFAESYKLTGCKKLRKTHIFSLISVLFLLLSCTHAALSGSTLTLSDNVFNDGENTVVIEATSAANGDRASIDYQVLRDTATLSPSTIS